MAFQAVGVRSDGGLGTFTPSPPVIGSGYSAISFFIGLRRRSAELQPAGRAFVRHRLSASRVKSGRAQVDSPALKIYCSVLFRYTSSHCEECCDRAFVI